MKAFKAYDIRGEWEVDFNAEDVYRIGFFLPTILKANTILVGRDLRHSSDTVFNALSRGITDAGANVHDAGLCTTPLVYWATGYFHYNGSVMITASHNPKNHNGLKVSGTDVMPIGYDNGLSELEYLVENKTITPSATKGLIQKIEPQSDYLRFLKSYVKPLSNIRIGIDCSNGMAALFVKQLIENEPFYINDTADGSFPGHEPNPLEPENQEQIKELVEKHQCDIGLIFDGDADRVMFIDEKGNFVSPDLIIALLGHFFFDIQGREGIVLQDIRSSKAIEEYLQQFGAKVETWRVGRAYAASKLREINGLYGGELAGHYYFRDFYYSDSGLMAALIVLGLVDKFSAKGISLSQLIQNISPYHNSGEINFKVEAKQEAIQAVVDYFSSKEKPQRILTFDGVRLEYPTFWLNIRPSNTEPYLRFIAESVNPEELKNLIQTTKEIVATFK